MRFLLMLALSPLLFLSCKKATTNAKQTCYKGRFVAEGCWTVIQLLEPLDESLPTAPYGVDEHTLGAANLPEKYKDGQPFYFTVNSVDSNTIYLTYCLPTKYFVEIDSISDNPCGQSEK